jgi:hypothetical protein
VIVDPASDSKTPRPPSLDSRDAQGYYHGKIGSPAEHRTVGGHRAWCHDCGEWCYPSAPCGEPQCCSDLSSLDDGGSVWVHLPAEDVAFIRGFHPDRDRTASRADMVRVIEHLQAALDGDA